MLQKFNTKFQSSIVRNLNALMLVIRGILVLVTSVKYRVELAIPLLDKEQGKVDSNRIEQVVTQVRNKCGGHNITEGIGEWVSPSGVVFTEGLYMLRTDTDFENAVWCRDMANSEWQRVLNQESIYISVSVVFWM